MNIVTNRGLVGRCCGVCVCWALVGVLLACASPAAEETRSEQASEQGAVEETAPYDPALEPLVTMAKEDLAERLEIGVGEIEVLEAKLLVWPNASMGCPQPEMMYIQVPQDGSMIRLQVGDEVFQYHTGGDRMPFLCEELKPPLDPPSKSDAESD